MLVGDDGQRRLIFVVHTVLLCLEDWGLDILALRLFGFLLGYDELRNGSGCWWKSLGIWLLGFRM